MPLASTPIIYWYPDPTGTLETIDLARVSALTVDHSRAVVQSESLAGRVQTVDFGGRQRIRVVRSPFSDSTGALLRDLTALDTHLQRGGRIGFALRQDKAWAAWGTRFVLRGNTSIQHSGVGFYEPTATLASGDEVWITSANPERTEELVTVSAATGSSATLSEAARYSHRVTPVLLRHRDYYPVCRLAAEARGRSILQDLGRRLVWELTLDLVEDSDALWSLAPLGGASLRGTTQSSRPSLEEAIRPPPASTTQRASTTTTTRRF